MSPDAKLLTIVGDRKKPRRVELIPFAQVVREVQLGRQPSIDTA